MKKFLLPALLLLTLVSSKTNAQLKDNLSFGPIVGFGHSFISGGLDGGTEKKFHPSFNAGLRLIYSANPNWGIGSDFSFRTEGAKVVDKFTNEEDRLNSNYLRLDPKVYYFFGESGKAFRPKISVGPSFGYLIGGKVKHYEGGSFAYDFKSSEIINKFGFGIAGALGFNYRIKSGTWLNIDAAYNHGLKNINKENDDEPIRNRSIFLNVGLLVGIGSARAK